MEDDKFFLPHEIIFSILKRLPVKSLLRFRCVCKDWNDLFKTSLFIKEYLHHSSHHRGPSLLLQWDYSIFGMLDSDKKTFLPLRAPSVNQPAYMIDIIGSSYGLVCLQIKVGGSLFLWNPATREVQYVPRSKNTRWYQICHIGFGFSRVVNDYKIVRTYYYLKRVEVEVYSLSTGSWKQLEFGNLLEGVSLHGRFAATDEAIYWFAYLNDIVILSFDMATEAITLIPAGPNIHWNVKLMAYENKLALLSGMKLWVMEETTSGGFGQRWNKTKLILNLPSVHSMTIWKNEVIYKCEPVGLYLFNLTTNKLKFLIPWEYGRLMSAFNYVESLVSIGKKNSWTSS
ncbi:hypothetical protein QN277_005849 [Acacia crassicarpa]|uniref:F-box domain-containing protein n=1 Tax=Acacia crassicarpa TaxID=499986 RepID=A0AAE1MGS8_9FABA|nr:hypothetical protein QN277_005849 [Acacia crassicarpa]